MATLLANLPIIDKSNKTDIVKECNSTNDKNVLKEIIYNLGMQVIIGDAQPELVVSTFYEMVKNKQVVVNVICDILAILDIESQIMDKSYRDNFVALLNMSNNRIVSDWLLKERLDYPTIGEAGIINNFKNAQTKFIKLKTKLYYKQQKFNLFREESEGYSKLLTELCQSGTFDPVYMLNAIKSLIGCFNLDPNRVLDIILECFEARLYLKKAFIPLITNFLENSSTLNQILAFKFNFYNSDLGLDIPVALYDLTALIIFNNLIQVENIYPYLLPLDSKITEIYKTEIDEAKKFPRKISEILSVEGSKHEDINIYEDENLRIIGSNQKLGLILSLIKIGDWKNASKMMNRLPENFAVSYPSICDALCELMHFLIDPLYRSNSGLPTVLASRIKPYILENVSVKQVETFEEFKSQIVPMIYALGPYLYRNTLLITKIIRIGRNLITIDSELRFDLISMLNVSILPAFALVESNSALSEELWSLLRLFPYNERFYLYNTWKLEPTSPLLIKMKFYIMKRIRYIMKRISKDKDSIKQSGRLIGKLSHSNPTYLFEYILGQIQSYDNLIGPVVDSLKYLSSVSYDVLLFCIIEVLSNSAKEHSKHEGTSISPWLISLANFCGSVVKKYPIELPGLLQFIANQLKIGKCLDLLILKEIVQKMTGIETSEEMTDEHLEAMSGGELLKSEGGSFNQVRNIKKSTLRLKDALLENNLAMALCILMSQQRDCILFQSENTHLKLIGKLYDQCQETLVQYGNFLSYSLTIDDYKRRLPMLKELFVDFNLSPDVTFFLSRPMINHDINSIYEEFLNNKAEKSKSHSIECYTKACDTVLNPLVESIIPALNNKYCVDLNLRFFVTFWTLTMYDLKVPEKSYMRERTKINQQLQQLEDNKDIAPSKKRKERERFLSIIAKLYNEASQQTDHTERVLKRLDTEKAHWFESTVNKMDVTTNFLQHCLFPRCKFSASDALYCSKFVHLLHCLKTPNFSTLICFDRIFGDISYTMSSCTENEANHYGRFLCSILQISMRWHKDVKVFEEECAKFPGFVTKFCEKDPVHIDYESYRHVCHKWHYRLTKAFILCLDSSDYIQIRNSLIVLTKLLPFFPVMISFAQAIERRLENIRNEEKEKRPDLFVLATGYSGQLKLKKGTFIPESEFHEKENKKSAPPPPSGTFEQSKPSESSEEVSIKKEHKTPDHNESKSQTKTKNSHSQKSHPRSSEVSEVEPKKKESKNDYKLKKPQPIEDKPTIPSINKEIASAIRTESHTSSASSSPKRTEYRSKDNESEEKDYKKRKVESKNSTEDNDNKRTREDASQSRSSSSTYDKKPLRKRANKDSTQDSPDAKRKKEDEKAQKRSEDRDARKSDTKRTSSRRYKQEEEK